MTSTNRKGYSIYSPNSHFLKIKCIKDFHELIEPKQTLTTYKNALLTNTNHLFVRGVYVPTGLVTTNDDKKLTFFLRNYLFFKARFFTPVHTHKGVFIFAHDRWSKNFYHWFCEALPRFITVIQEFPNSVIILPQEHLEQNFIGESLNLLKIPFASVDQKISNKFEKILTIKTDPPIPKVNGYFQKKLKEVILESLDLKESVESKKIYISRRNAKYRRIINEDDVMSLVKEFGYEVVEPEKLSFEDQVRTFFAAKSIIGLHGAGLTNIMYMQEGTKLLEIRNEVWNSQPVCYWHLANIFKIRWDFFLASPVGKVSNVNDIEIDVEEFREKVLSFECN